MRGRHHQLLERLRRRLAAEEGFTLVELTIVLLILTILFTIALPSYLSVRDRADQSAAKQDVSQASRAVVAYGTDNFSGSRSDPNSTPDDQGYENITLPELATNYDATISVLVGAPYIIDPAGWSGDPATDYCLTALSGRWTAVQHGPNDQIHVGLNFDAATCSVS
jgi:prepilin-type N-terminal cleavage/methylation domain-containing protein